MAEEKKSFILYADQITSFEGLTDEEAGKLIKHIYRYVNDLDPVMEDRLISAVFEPIKQQLKRDLKQWEATRSKRAKAGKEGGIKSGLSRRSKANEANASNPKQNEANEAVNVNVNDNDNVFINIGTERFLMSPSQVAQSNEFLQRTETTLQTALKGINTTALWQQFDKNYACHDFTDRNHFYNALKKIGEEILIPPVKGYGVNTTSPTTIPELTRPL